MPSLVAVACFLPGRTKDLSAPPRKHEMCVNDCESRRLRDRFKNCGISLFTRWIQEL